MATDTLSHASRIFLEGCIQVSVDAWRGTEPSAASGMTGSAVAKTQQFSVIERCPLGGFTQEMASQIINTLQQAGRGTEPYSTAAETSKRQRKEQKAELALVLHAPVGPLRPLNS